MRRAPILPCLARHRWRFRVLDLHPVRRTPRAKGRSFVCVDTCGEMSESFVRIRLYRERASEFELLAETEASPDVRLRFRVIARHYRELMDRELQADKARMAELMERARLQRQQAAPKVSLPPTSDTQSFLIAAE
jgi:hypothetical protein